MAKMKLFTMAMSDEEHARFGELAASYGMTKADLVRHALAAYVRQTELGKPCDLIAVDYATLTYAMLKLRALQRDLEAMDERLDRARAEFLAAAESQPIDNDYMDLMLDDYDYIATHLNAYTGECREISRQLAKIDDEPLLGLSRMGRVTIGGAAPDNRDEENGPSRSGTE